MQLENKSEKKIEQNKSKSIKINKDGLCQWIVKGGINFIPSEKLITIKTVPSGLYSIKHNDQWGYYLFKEVYHTDEILLLPSNDVKRVINDINSFWEKGDLFAK